MVKDLKAFTLRSGGKKQGCPFLSLLFNIRLEGEDIAQMVERMFSMHVFPGSIPSASS